MIPTAETSPPSPTPHPAKRRRSRDTSLYGLGPDDRLIPLSEVKALTGYGATSIYAKIKEHVFPAPVKLGAPGGSRWVLGEIRKFNADAIAARDRARQSAGRPQGELAAALSA
jgi:prophage regulatory protein